MVQLTSGVTVPVSLALLVVSHVLLFASAAVIQSNSQISVPNNSSVQKEVPEDRVEFHYRPIHLKEIEHDVLRVVGDPQYIALACSSTKNESSLVRWNYHGLKVSQDFHLRKMSRKPKDERGVDFIRHLDHVFLNLSDGPPVARIECISAVNMSITNNTMIYTGDGKPPYLFNNGKTVSASVLNETTARLPCILNYPIDNVDDQLELQLFKDGEKIENTNSCLSYTTELGYLLNLTQLENPLGSYECRVLNSVGGDFVTVILQKDAFIRVEPKRKNLYFLEGAPPKHPFQCKFPKSLFVDTFQWFYQWKNGSYTPINETVQDTQSDPLHYSQDIKITFPSREINHVVCAGMLKDSSTLYNNSFFVHVTESIEPNVYEAEEPPGEPVIYTTGKNITCSTKGNPVTWKWLKDGEPINDLDITDQYGGPIRRSTLSLRPSADDKENNYTCVVSNFLGTANYSFRVQLKDPEPPKPDSILIYGLSAGLLLTVIVILVFIFKPRHPIRISEEQVMQFFQGLQSNEPGYNELGPYESGSYDSTKEIKKKDLIFERELKGGNFGKVFSGKLLFDDGRNIPVAIKTFKNKANASAQELDYAFRNFSAEIKYGQGLGSHPNVVGYIGAVTERFSDYEVYLVMEWCSQGDLKTYLRNNKESFHDDIQGLHQTRRLSGSTSCDSNFILKTSHLMRWAEDIAAGMKYISEKNLVHRDLAARNVLLCHPNPGQSDPGLLVPKISDFGMSKSLELLQQEYYQIVLHEDDIRRELPLRWMSPEALEYLRFTKASDVWAFGVTLWEMFKFGNLPYYEECFDRGGVRETLVSHLRAGNVLHEPEYAPPEIWDILLQCWNESPSERPNFRTLEDLLHAINENVNNEFLRIPEAPAVGSDYVQVGLAAENLTYVGIGAGDFETSSEPDYDSDSNTHSDQYVRNESAI